MKKQHQDSYVWTWEPAVGAVIGFVLLAIFSLQTGRSLALLLAGQGWQWPDSTQLVTSSWAILHGDSLAGLGNHTMAPGVWMWILAALICATLTAGTGWLVVRHLRSARHRGMATTGEAMKLLGTARLRAQRAVIRPDLYRKQTR